MLALTDPTGLERLYRRRPWIGLSLVLGLAAALAAGSQLTVDFTPQKIFESGDADFDYLVQVQEVFGRDDTLFVVHVQAEEVFRDDVVDYLRALHAKFEAVDGVVGVEDPTTLWVVREGHSLPTPLLAAGGALDEARSVALGHPLIRGRLISAGSKAALVIVRVAADRQAFDLLSPVVHDCMQVLEETPAPGGVETSFTGIPAARVLIAERLINDQLRFFPIVTGLFVVILWLAFRDLRALSVPLAAVLLATVYTAGLLGATGESINIINNVLPVLIFVIAMSDAIHVISRYRRELAAGQEKPAALWTTVRHLAVACLLTSLTTAIGFGSLAVADISILQRFGLFAALGVGIAYVVTIVFVPLAFSYLSPVLGASSRRADALIDSLASRLGQLVIRRRKSILAGSALLIAAAVWSASGVRVDNNVYEAFDTDDPFVEANRRLERDFAGIVSVSVVVSWDEGSPGPLTPEALAYLAELQAALDEAGISGMSVVDLIQEWNVALHRGDPAQRRIPESAEECRGALIGMATALEVSGRSELLRRVWAGPQRLTRIVGQIGDLGSTQLNEIFLGIEERLREDAARQQTLGLRCRLSGDGPVASRGIDRLIWDLFSSLLTAFAVIFPVMCLLLRSVRAGLVSMIPNLFPILLTLGFMGAVGMELRVTSVIVFSISLGLAVDDTIHFMVRFGEEWRRGGVGPDAYSNAILATYRGTGAAIVLTTVLLAAGFSALLFSGFPISRSFALCMEITVLGALVGDLIVLPAVLATLRPMGAEAEGPADESP